jgi:hypothetical protein
MLGSYVPHGRHRVVDPTRSVVGVCLLLCLEVMTPNFIHAEISALFQQRVGSVRFPPLEVDTVFRLQSRAHFQKGVCPSKSAFSGNVHGLDA